MSGGTLLRCKDVVLEAGASKVSAFVTHAVFPMESWRKICDEKIPFQNFYITDSIGTVADTLQGVKPFHVLSLADSISQYCGEYILD